MYSHTPKFMFPLSTLPVWSKVEAGLDNRRTEHAGHCSVVSLASVGVKVGVMSELYVSEPHPANETLGHLYITNTGGITQECGV